MLNEYISYRLKRANETIEEVKILIENKLWNTAINRMYYACFYAVGALLIKNGVKANSHSGIRQKFGQLFVQTGLIDRNLGKLFSELFEKGKRVIIMIFLILMNKQYSAYTQNLYSLLKKLKG
jgi:uncharacterized protein (UPF0332 family)